jgi:TatA/E family protein of Tat protein translocase
MTTSLFTLGFLGNIGLPEYIVIGLVLLLLFGSRLPEVGKSLGKGIVEFKKGLKGVEDEVDQQTNAPDKNSKSYQDGYEQARRQFAQQNPMGNGGGMGSGSQTVSRAENVQ